MDFSRKHTANVHESLNEIRHIIENLVERRDERRDGFARLIRGAMETRLGDDADACMKILHKRGITRKLASQALEIAKENGRFTIFSVVDALTRLSSDFKNAGDRAEADERAGKLLSLVA